MLKMSIRRQLFLAFTLVAAISSAALLVLARSYVRNVRGQLDRHFLEDGRAALNRQDQQSGSWETQALDIVSDGALDPNMLSSLMSDESQLQKLFQSVPALLQLAVFDEQKGKLLHTWARHGTPVEPLSDRKIEAMLAEPHDGAHVEVNWGAHPVGRTTVIEDNRFFAIANTGSDAAPRATVVGEIALAELFKSVGFANNGRVLLFDFKSGKPWLGRDEAERVHESIPGLDRLLAERPENGTSIDVDDGHGRRYRVYSAVSAELPTEANKRGCGAIALLPLDELYAPLASIRMRVVASVIGTILLAMFAALLSSGRFVADIERIRRAVAAFAQGDWQRLEKSSRDELGGALVDSINDMATAVAERMRRDEAESWRSLVRVVSHEINNTLAPVRSVAATLRSGLEKRLRENDAGADVDMALKLIVERVDALAKFIDGYAEVAKLPEPTRRLTDVGRLLDGATTLFAEDAGARGIALEVRAENAGALELDAQQMERVLVNLIKNAIEAAPRGSAVDVLAARVAGGLEILVADAGPGISAEARRNLFVPYFTTKPGGSGVGLALARQIVVAHGGTITAERSPSGGTLMRVVVPDVAHGHPYREVG
ncbi:MAG TPA: HAMP domain-containing sensor histidine kinase [Polyangia bacterium]|jgi:signal transduction histidine kinase